jgi:glycosyltransferase involved in cell wall biosynthesis
LSWPPLLHGGGTRLKIIEAAACGKCIISTSLGAEGLEFTEGHDIVLADSPSEFAGAVVSFLRDPNRRREIGSRAREVSLNYSWNLIGKRFLDVVESIQLAP